MDMWKKLGGIAAIICWLTWSLEGASAQSVPHPVEVTNPPLSFEVVSIKQNKGDSFPQIWGKPGDNPFRVVGMPLESLICFTFDIQDPSLIAGYPKWTETERYDIDAKVSDEDYPRFETLTLAQKKLMLQTVLVARFKLRYHYEQRLIGIYELVIAKGGPRMKQTTPVADASGGSYFGDGQPNTIRAASVSIEKLSQILTVLAGKQVVDKTGLVGGFDFKLRWDTATSANAPHSARTDSTLPSESPDPPLFTAIQEQLGLKLQPRKATLPVLVVDSIERPSPN